MTVCDRMLRGKYGKVLKSGRVPYVSLAGVEAHHGVRFSEQQIALAIDGRPERLLIAPDNQEED
jgi:hypothetical protein